MPQKLIDLLADGQSHSGVALGKALGVTRSAIGKQITKLKEMGFQVDSVKGAGYRLCMPFERLNVSVISSYFFDSSLCVTPKVEVFWSLDSTNDHLIASIKDGRITESGCVCLAEHQRSGRGRRGKAWVSPLGGGLYFSIAYRFERGAESLEGLSLSMAMAVIEVLEQKFFINNLKIKWPNDIFLDEKKLGGILIDVMGEAGGPCWAIIGIGLNVCGMELSMRGVDQPWTDLSSNAEEAVSRNKLAAALIERVIGKSQAHERNGFELSDVEWQKYDAFVGRQVIVSAGENGFFGGIQKGISKGGGLIVEVDGVQRIVRSGEVSLRRA